MKVKHLHHCITGCNPVKCVSDMISVPGRQGVLYTIPGRQGVFY